MTCKMRLHCMCWISQCMGRWSPLVTKPCVRSVVACGSAVHCTLPDITQEGTILARASFSRTVNGAIYFVSYQVFKLVFTTSS